jgi:hypothetical protein
MTFAYNYKSLPVFNGEKITLNIVERVKSEFISGFKMSPEVLNVIPEIQAQLVEMSNDLSVKAFNVTVLKEKPLKLRKDYQRIENVMIVDSKEVKEKNRGPFCPVRADRETDKGGGVNSLPPFKILNNNLPPIPKVLYDVAQFPNISGPFVFH